MSFDPDCFDLAEHFLPNDAAKRVKNELAQHIQDAIEDFLSVYDTDEEIPREEQTP
jgi:hypothetical protein